MDPNYGTDLEPLVDLPLNPIGRARITAQTAGAVTSQETRPTVTRIVLEIPESDRSAPFVTLDWTYEGADGTTTTEALP